MNESLKALEDLTFIKEQLPFYDCEGYERGIDESDFKTIEKALKKYKDIEDIEERYGIGMLTIFKVMTDGCYHCVNGEIKHFIPSGSDFACPNFDNESIDLMYASPYEDSCHIEKSLFFEDLGKKWALTKEELKNDPKRN